jgi:hypothetical protein
MQQIPEHHCETPKPLSLFQSVKPELALRKSANAGLIILFHNFDEEFIKTWLEESVES